MISAQEVNYGALVISLDFELHWGMRDLCDTNHPYIRRIKNARKVIPQIFDMFEEYDIAATWATVGFLFAESNSELEKYSPTIVPQYTRKELDPYMEPVGQNEQDDPIHYAPSLIREIQKRDRQEIATHTFSHYYCLEDGQSRETFDADLNSAIEIARKYDISIHSIVFPRNQYNPLYDDVLLKRNIICYRGNERHPSYQTERPSYYDVSTRIYRLLDSYLNLSGPHIVSWDQVVQESGLCCIASSRFFRPYSRTFSIMNRIRLQRIVKAMYQAAKDRKIFHLWWHPHNFGDDCEENLTGLKYVLDHFSKYRDLFGMRSLNMDEASRIAKSTYRNNMAANSYTYESYGS